MISSKGIEIERNSMHILLKDILMVIQFFGLMPLEGIRKTGRNLKFKLKSLKIFYFAILASSFLFYTFYIFLYTFYYGRNLFNIVVFLSNLRGLVGLFLYLEVARKWPSLIEQWEIVELVMIKYGPTSKFSSIFKIIGIFFLTLGLTQYGMYIGLAISLSPKDNGKSPHENYFLTIYSEFFFAFDYSIWKAIPIEILSVIGRVIWQFSNYFIIILSLSISKRFEQLNASIRKQRILDSKFWMQLQFDYNKLSLLCEKLNETISGIVMLAFCGNLYFMATLLYENLKSEEGSFEKVYHYYCALFYFVHIITVNLAASSVYEESRKPIGYLLSVPSELYSVEVERFIIQLENKKVALSGGNLFDIDKGVVLEIASAIVALQLILVQFDQSVAKED